MLRIFALSFLLDFILNGIIANCWVAVFTKGGFSLVEAAIASSVMCFGIALFELPTGYLADRYLGRRGSTQVGSGILIGSMAVLFTSSNFAISCMAIAGAGFGSTFISGAKQAWLRNVVSDRYPHRLKRFFFDIDLVGRAGTIAGVWAGAYLIEHISASSVWGMGALAGLGASVISLTIPGASGDHKDVKITSKLFSSESLRIIQVPALALLLVASLFFGIEDGIRGVVFQPFVMKLASGNSMVLAYQATITLLPRILGSLIYRRFLASSPHPTGFLTLAILVIAIIEASLVGITDYWIFAGLWALAVFAFGVFFPLRETVLHETIDQIGAEKWRATIISFDSLVGNLLQGLTCLGLAAVISEKNMDQFFVLSAAALGLCGGCYWWATVVAKRGGPQPGMMPDKEIPKETVALYPLVQQDR